MSLFSNVASLFPSASTIKSNVSANISSVLNNAFQSIHGGAPAAAPAPASNVVHALGRVKLPAENLVITGNLPKLFSPETLSWAGKLSDGVSIVEPSISGKFHTQTGAANYIADQTASFGNGPVADKKVQDAVRSAVASWKPGQDLSALVRDAVKSALKGVLPDSYTPAPGSFASPHTPDAVANLVAGQIRANGTDPIGTAEHMLAAQKAYRPPA